MNMEIARMLDEVSEWFDYEAVGVVEETNVYIDDQGAEVQYHPVPYGLQQAWFDFMDDLSRKYSGLDIETGYLGEDVVYIDVLRNY